MTAKSILIKNGYVLSLNPKREILAGRKDGGPQGTQTRAGN
ncbi:MAG: hypothetical protein ACW98U_13420 [Candidatus Thorarchaeota archaeon]